MKSDFIYGHRAVVEAIMAGKEIDKIFIRKNLTGESLRDILKAVTEYNVPYQFVPPEKLDNITNQNHQGIIAYMSAIEYQQLEQLIPLLYEKGEVPLFLVLDHITDVRNFGSIARSAECAGVHAIIIPDKGAAQINADAIKTSAGALLEMNICRVKSLNNTLKYLMECGIQLVAATEKAATDYTKFNFNNPVAIVMGAEDTGIASDLLKIIPDWVKIPINGRIASLNVAVAAGVMAYEAVRQREVKN